MIVIHNAGVWIDDGKTGLSSLGDYDNIVKIAYRRENEGEQLFVPEADYTTEFTILLSRENEQRAVALCKQWLAVEGARRLRVDNPKDASWLQRYEGQVTLRALEIDRGLRVIRLVGAGLWSPVIVREHDAP